MRMRKKVYQDILEEEEEPHKHCLGCKCCIPEWLL